tara:strand:- start:1482 stop:1817 length:336 start_codon:yes stop_codon:yes gene_type:complete
MLCLLSVEIFIRSNYLVLISSTIKVSKRAIDLISNKNISDHWKECIIPKYAMQMMRYSLQMLFILCLIAFVFIIADNFSNGLLSFSLSLNGMIESLIFVFAYAYFRKNFFR